MRNVVISTCSGEQQISTRKRGIAALQPETDQFHMGVMKRLDIDLVSARMKAVRHCATAPELRVGDAIRAEGMRFRTNVSTLPGRPDLANRTRRWALFVNGCFWHGHASCRRSTIPKTNSRYWQVKIALTRVRDRASAKNLQELGYCVGTIWECQIQAPDQLNTRIKRFIRRVEIHLAKSPGRTDKYFARPTRIHEAKRRIEKNGR